MNDKHTALLPFGTYILIWLTLVMLTGVTVTATTLRLGNLSIYAAIGIALVKSVLVVLFFMNLKREQMIFKIMLLVALVTLAVIMLLTFIDTAYR